MALSAFRLLTLDLRKVAPMDDEKKPSLKARFELYQLLLSLPLHPNQVSRTEVEFTCVQCGAKETVDSITQQAGHLLSKVKFPHKEGCFVGDLVRDIAAEAGVTLDKKNRLGIVQ